MCCLLNSTSIKDKVKNAYENNNYIEEYGNR